MKTEEDVKRKIEALKFLLEVERSKPEMERDYKLIQGFEDSITWLEWIFQEADKE